MPSWSTIPEPRPAAEAPVCKNAPMTDRQAGRGDWQGPPPRRWLATCARSLAAALVANALSSHFGDVVTAVVVVILACILTGTSWLHELPPRAPLVQIALWTLLGGAIVSMIVATSVSRLDGSASIAAVFFITGAVLIPNKGERAITVLFSFAGTGAGFAGIGVGVAALGGGDLPVGVAGICGGLMLISAGAMGLLYGTVLTGVAAIGFGVSAISFGVTLLLNGSVLTGWR